MRSLLTRLCALWAGNLPLRQAFWDYAVFWGLIVNLTLSGASLAILLIMRHSGLPDDVSALSAPLMLAMHAVPLPYNVITLVGVWRSSAQPRVTFGASTAARAAMLALFVLYLVI
jgi:hypothetical protein